MTRFLNADRFPASLENAPVCGAGNQRVVGGGGSGNGDAAAGGAAAALGGFGFLGLISLFRSALGGDPAGRSSAITGLGSSVVDPALAKSPATRITCTGTVAGSNRGSV